MNSVTKPKKRHVPKPEDPSFSDIIVDKIVEIFGTWQILVLHLVWFAIWIIARFDIHTLTFWVSLEAILLSLLILISQQRQTEFDRTRAETDLEIDRIDEKQTRILTEMVREIGEKVGINEFEVDKKPNNK